MATLLSVAMVESYSLRFGNRARESQSAGVGISLDHLTVRLTT
jgi:hypothetical protein